MRANTLGALINPDTVASVISPITTIGVKVTASRTNKAPVSTHLTFDLIELKTLLLQDKVTYTVGWGSRSCHLFDSPHTVMRCTTYT